jgi:hypothetical protein
MRIPMSVARRLLGGSAPGPRRALPFSLAILVLGVTAIALAQATVDGARPACVDASAQARMQAFGYDHVVTIRNGCDRPVHCTVTTSVNPTPSELDVPPGQTRDTLAWRGSPASTFVAHVDCR